MKILVKGEGQDTRRETRPPREESKHPHGTWDKAGTKHNRHCNRK